MGHTTRSDLSSATKRVSAALAEAARLRMGLLSLELRHEQGRALRLLLALVGVALTAALELACASAALLILVWDTHRVEAIVGLCFFYAIALGLLIGWLVVMLRRAHPPFQVTREVLTEDLRGIRFEP